MDNWNEGDVISKIKVRTKVSTKLDRQLELTGWYFGKRSRVGKIDTWNEADDISEREAGLAG